jgi:hypothetical protein
VSSPRRIEVAVCTTAAGIARNVSLPSRRGQDTAPYLLAAIYSPLPHPMGRGIKGEGFLIRASLQTSARK